MPAADEAEPNAVIGNGPNSATAVRDYVCVLSKVGEDGLEEHIGTVRIANEPLHRWVMGPALANPEAIVRTVSRVIPGGL